MTFALQILGVSGAAPAHGRFPTSQYLQIQTEHFLVDCGEGAQIQMERFGVPRRKIEHVFISHLHGDHIFGLPGFIFSLALHGRKNPLEIHSPPGLEKMILGLLSPDAKLPFTLIFSEFDAASNQVVWENQVLQVTTIPLRHRIPTCGFLFHEKPFERNVNPLLISELNLSIPQIKAVKDGHGLEIPGTGLIPNSDLTLPPWHQRSYAFISDSIFDNSIVPAVAGVDLLYHESTFCQDFSEHATKTMHSTAAQAAQIARAGQVGKLVLGHYSTRYRDISIFLEEAAAIFPNTSLGREGNVYEVVRKRVENPA